MFINCFEWPKAYEILFNVSVLKIIGEILFRNFSTQIDIICLFVKLSDADEKSYHANTYSNHPNLNKQLDASEKSWHQKNTNLLKLLSSPL